MRRTALPARTLAPAPAAALPSARGVRWCAPDEDMTGELVLCGKTREAVDVLVEELRATDRFLRAGVDPSTRVLFQGPSGTGKTLAARWIGWTLRLPVAILDVAAIVGSHLGETGGNIAGAFSAVAAIRGIVFLDELDAICAPRAGGESAADKELSRATTTLLQQIDWLEPARIVIAATNFPDGIDGALRRRFPTELEFVLPTRDARRMMLAQWLSRSPIASDLDELADNSCGMTGAELRAFAMTRARRAVLARPEEPAAATPPPADEQRRQITNGAQGVLSALGEEVART